MNSNYELLDLKKPTTLKKLDIAKKESMLKLPPDNQEKIEPAYERIKETISVKTERKKKEEIRKQPKTKEEWLEQKLKFPNKYGMTAQGDLESYDGGVTIELIPKVPASTEYIKEQISKKTEECIQAQQAYTDAKRELYQLIQGFNASGKNTTDASVIMNANQKVHDAECVLNSITKSHRSITKLEDIKTRELHMNKFYDVSKLADPVLSGIYTTFDWKLFWMDKPQEVISEQIPEDVPLEPTPQTGGKRDKTPEEKARIWAIIRAKKAKSSFK